MCDYEPANEVHFPEVTGGVAGGLRARVETVGGTAVASGHATASYCCHVHRDLGEYGVIRASGQVSRELARYPLLADGHEVGE